VRLAISDIGRVPWIRHLIQPLWKFFKKVAYKHHHIYNSTVRFLCLTFLCFCKPVCFFLHFLFLHTFLLCVKFFYSILHLSGEKWGISGIFYCEKFLFFRAAELI